VELLPVPPATLVSSAVPESSAVVATRIASARERQRRRSKPNSRLTGRALVEGCALTSATQRTLVALAELEELSARGTERLLRTARTIADLGDASAVEDAHLEEAARYRSPARRLADRLAR
jgi:magnesium chelatase family protein